jgi:uncharacterized RDD family membrane protein YckC
MPPPPPPPPGNQPPPAPPYGGSPPGYTPYGGGVLPSHYATFGARLGAYLIDGLVMFLIGLPFDIGSWFGVRKAFENCYSIKNVDTGNTSIHCPGDALNTGWLAIAIALAVVGALVAIFFYCKKVAQGQSWGHKALGIRIVDINTNQSISAGKAFGRLICRNFISGVLCGLGFLWMLWDPKKQTWHDKIVSTIVIKA